MWEEFNAMQTALRNARGRTVGEAMHEAAIISPDTSIMSAANTIVRIMNPVHTFDPSQHSRIDLSPNPNLITFST